MNDKRAGAASTEGAYWKYESFLKKEDAKLCSLVGAAGELFSIRTKLFNPVAEDTLLDDFMISMDIVRQGYKIDYEPKALASEKPSFNIREEQVRKVRIAAGGIQAVIRNIDLCNPFQYGIVSLQFIIHRVSRWTITPIFIIAAFVANLFLLNNGMLYQALLAAQFLFHTAALTGYYLSTKQIKVRVLHIPFYFDFMHYCVLLGWFRYSNGKQKATWQKATRLSYN
jgi:cellulose synthase/poly-beta-1,6-N-acetylglucosamine synthase-like glycosyltransferase